MEQDQNTFWEFRYLLTSPRWTARLPRNGFLAMLFGVPLTCVMAVLLGGPSYLGDFPLPWRIWIVALPIVMGLFLFARMGNWLVKTVCALVVLSSTGRVAITRFPYLGGG
jgi:hypothetical protein